jgi:cytochrome P450
VKIIPFVGSMLDLKPTILGQPFLFVLLSLFTCAVVFLLQRHWTSITSEGSNNFEVAALIAFGCFLCGLWFFALHREKRKSSPGPDLEPTVPIVSNATWSQDPFAFLVKHSGSGNYAFRRNGVMHLVVQSPDQIREIFDHVGSELDRFPNTQKRFLRGERSLEFLFGEEHKTRKLAVVHAMDFNSFRRYMYTLSTLSAAYARRLDGCGADQCKSVLKEFGLAAVSVIILGTQLTAVELEEYLRLFHQHFTGLNATRNWNIPGTTYFQGTQAKKELERRLRLRVRKCRRANNGDDPESVLFRLAKSDLPEDDIVDNLLMLWAAGFEPVRITLAWILAFLGTHPEVRVIFFVTRCSNNTTFQVKQLVQQEVEALATRFCADKWDSSSSDAIWEAVRSMKYTECVLYETLRMRPPATHVSFGINPRLSSYRVGEVVVPAGWRIICGWTGVFNDPRL